MDPQILKAAFRMGALVFGLAVLMLPFQERSSAEFVVSILAAVVGLLFLGAVWGIARWSAPRIPTRSDKQVRTRFNGPESDERPGRDHEEA